MRRPLLAATGLATLLALLIPVAPATADHRTEPPGTVTLVGNLQDEVGCASDWAPASACTESRSTSSCGLSACGSGWISGFIGVLRGRGARGAAPRPLVDDDGRPRSGRPGEPARDQELWHGGAAPGAAGGMVRPLTPDDAVTKRAERGTSCDAGHSSRPASEGGDADGSREGHLL